MSEKRQHRRLLAALVAVTLAGTTGGAVARTFLARASWIGDGDSLWVREVDGRRTELRLHGIDAPEICQDGGVRARDALRAAVHGALLRVTTVAVDRYGRTLATMQVEGAGDAAVRLAAPDSLADAEPARSVNARLVAGGHAWNLTGGAWRDDPGRYAAEQQQAADAHRGVHARADAQSPQDFRRAHGRCPPTPPRAAHRP